jgi:hypothetical protein
VIALPVIALFGPSALSLLIALAVNAYRARARARAAREELALQAREEAAILDELSCEFTKRDPCTSGDLTLVFRDEGIDPARLTRAVGRLAMAGKIRRARGGWLLAGVEPTPIEPASWLGTAPGVRPSEPPTLTENRGEVFPSEGTMALDFGDTDTSGSGGVS